MCPGRGHVDPFSRWIVASFFIGFHRLFPRLSPFFPLGLFRGLTLCVGFSFVFRLFWRGNSTGEFPRPGAFQRWIWEDALAVGIEGSLVVFQVPSRTVCKINRALGPRSLGLLSFYLCFRLGRASGPRGDPYLFLPGLSVVFSVPLIPGPTGQLRYRNLCLARTSHTDTQRTTFSQTVNNRCPRRKHSQA